MPENTTSWDGAPLVTPRKSGGFNIVVGGFLYSTAGNGALVRLEMLTKETLQLSQAAVGDPHAGVAAAVRKLRGV